MPQFRHSLLSAAAMLAFAGSLAFTAPVLAADASPAPAAKAAKPAVDPVEARIAKLHQQLQITADQENLFNGLAQVIVQSSKEAGELKLTARAEGLAPATLVLPSRACAGRPAVP